VIGFFASPSHVAFGLAKVILVLVSNRRDDLKGLCKLVLFRLTGEMQTKVGALKQLDPLLELRMLRMSKQCEVPRLLGILAIGLGEGPYLQLGLARRIVLDDDIETGGGRGSAIAGIDVDLDVPVH